MRDGHRISFHNRFIFIQICHWCVGIDISLWICPCEKANLCMMSYSEKKLFFFCVLAFSSFKATSYWNTCQTNYLNHYSLEQQHHFVHTAEHHAGTMSYFLVIAVILFFVWRWLKDNPQRATEIAQQLGIQHLPKFIRKYFRNRSFLFVYSSNCN